MTATVGIVGLGIMGSAFAQHLHDAGFAVVGYDLVDARVAALEELGGRSAGSPGEVAAVSELLITSLNKPEALAAVIDGDEGIAANARRGLVVADTSTFPLDVKEDARDRLAAAGVPMLDCTISGTGAQAQRRDVAVYGSGDEEAFERVRDAFAGFARAVRYLGAFGNGSRMKFVANHLVAIHNLATAEAILLGIRAGLDPHAVVEVIAEGAGTSRIFELRGPLMAEGRFSPPTASMATFAKDTHIIGDFAAQVGAPVPVFSATLPFYTAGMARGLADQDVASLLTVLQSMVDGGAGPGTTGVVRGTTGAGTGTAPDAGTGTTQEASP